MADYDTLSIKIVADSKGANANISKVTSSLESLQKLANELDFKKIEKVQKVLQDISKIDFSNVSNGLDSVVKSFKAMERASSKSLSGKVKGIANVPQLENVAPTNAMAIQMPDFSGIGGFDLTKINTQLGETTSLFSKFSSELNEVARESSYFSSSLNFDSVYNSTKALEPALQGVDKVVKELGLDTVTSNKGLVQFASDLGNLDNATKELQSTYGVLKTTLEGTFEPTVAPLKQMTKEMKALNKETEKSRSGFSKLVTQFQRIVKYRIIRKIIQEIYKALTSGIQNIAQFDDKTNEAMSNIKSTFSYLSNTLGAVLSPIMQILAPIIQVLGQALGDVANGFAEMFSAMAGNDTYAKATMQVEDYAEALKKTQSIGIDELNVIQKENQPFEQVAISDEVMERAKGFKEIFAGLKDIFSFIGDILKNAFQETGGSLMNLIKSFLNIIMQIADVLKVLVNNTMGGVHKSLGGFTDLIATILDLIGTIIYELKDVLEPIMQIIGVIINVVNEVLSVIFDVIKGILNILKPIIQLILRVIVPVLKVILNIILTIFYVLEAVIKTILYLISFQWDKIGGVWEDMGNKTKDAWNGKTGIGNVDSYATGGFPEDGFFYANHNELVGGFDNGRTAVANNEQITQGIYEAVRDAMRDSGGGNITIEMDGYEVAKVVSKKQANRGIDVLKGGKVNFGY